MRIKNAVVHDPLAMCWLDGTHATLLTPVLFTWDDDEHGAQEFLALKGTKIDGASVPWWGQWFIPRWGVLNFGMLIHDCAFKFRFQLTGERRVSRKYADQLLYCFARATGCDPLRAYCARYVVRWFGEAKWDHHDAEFRATPPASPGAPGSP